MEARNRIWEELKQAKANILCIQYYTNNRRKYNRYYNAFIAIMSSFGALGTLIDISIPIFTSFIVAFASIIKSILPNFLQSEPELSGLDSISDFYVRYMSELEYIWYRFYHGLITEEDAMKSFFKLKDTENDKQSVMNKGIRSISKKEQKRIDDEADEYINRVYFNKY